MPTELEELVEFLHHGNAQIRQTAAEHLTGYSQTHTTLFKRNELEPIRDLKLLIKDYAPIAKHAITILINISSDAEVLKSLDADDVFLGSVLARLTDAKEQNADLLAMLLANMAKSDQLARILTLKRKPVTALSKSDLAMDQLVDAFVKGSLKGYNKEADYDYLAYFFADVAKFEHGQQYFVTEREYDGVVPLTKLIVFTENGSLVRRKGVASAIKNIAFLPSTHPTLLSPSGINLLPYILLPLAGPETLSDEDMEKLPTELQLLPPDKQRDADVEVLKTHIETLLLLTTTRDGREALRDAGTYIVIREAHLAVEDEGFREVVERLVDLLMRDEEGEEAEGKKLITAPDEDDDTKVEEIF